MKISSRFIVGPFIGQDQYEGATIAAVEGFFLIFSISQLGQALGKTFIGSAYRFKGIEADIARAFGIPNGPVFGEKHVESLENPSILRCDYSELPRWVMDHPEWPPLKKMKDAWFIPGDAIDHFSLSIWYGIKISIGKSQYHIPVDMFSYRRVRRVLREMSWLKVDGNT